MPSGMLNRLIGFAPRGWTTDPDMMVRKSNSSGERDTNGPNRVIAATEPRAIGVINPGDDLFSHSVTRAVSSALGRFTTVFGMGTGGSTPLELPGSNLVD